MMAFYRLRSVLRERPGMPHDIRPNTRLRDLDVGIPRSFLRLLQAETGLHFHQLSPSLVGWTGRALI